MKLTSGEIYFVRERDVKTNEVTPYVKIGIVREGAKGPRTSAERLEEHQTGNPRELFLVDVISTPAVEEIETRLHKDFARDGVSGEWFKFDTDLLEAAKQRARKYRDEAQKNLFALEQSEIFKKTVSNGKKLNASEEALEWQKVHNFATALIKRTTALKGKFEALMIDSVEDITEIDHILTKQTRTGATFLNVSRIETELPDLFAQYLETEYKFTQRFTVKPLPLDELGIDQANSEDFKLLDAFDHKTDFAPTSQSEQEALHEQYLQVLAAESKALWNKQIAEAQIKSLCGEHEGIDGICSWPRENKEKQVFNQERFEAEHPDLFAQFTEKRADVEATIVDAKRGY